MTSNDINNERIDYVNDSLSLIQKTDGLTFGTDALLLAGYVHGRFERGAELGGGSGIISMLLLTREKVGKIDALEVQDEYADLIRRNAELNSLSDRLSSVCCDVRDFSFTKEYDVVFTNPPYMKSSSGRGNTLSKKNIARHEICGDISDFMAAGARMLKFGSPLYAVYRPDRLIDLIDALRRNRLEPKKMTFVQGDTKTAPSMVLIEAKKGAAPSLTLTKNLIMYKEGSRDMSEDAEKIYEGCSFAEFFKK